MWARYCLLMRTIKRVEPLRKHGALSWIQLKLSTRLSTKRISHRERRSRFQNSTTLQELLRNANLITYSFDDLASIWRIPYFDRRFNTQVRSLNKDWGIKNICNHNESVLGRFTCAISFRRKILSTKWNRNQLSAHQSRFNVSATRWIHQTSVFKQSIPLSTTSEVIGIRSARERQYQRF